jgi:cation:H+ antiporter
MLAVAVACLPIFFRAHRIARWEGLLFLAYYVAYTAYVILAAQSHDALPAYSAVMLEFVIPLTAVTIGVLTWRAWRAGPARHAA